MKLVLHPETARQLESFVAAPSHALLIEGPAGSGKAEIANNIAAQILGIDDATLSNYSFYLKVSPVDNVIPIATIRDMQQFVRLKTFGVGTIRRIIVIEDAHRMTIEAQNALLKLLEEPPADTAIIFTVAPDQALLSTIYSRAQHIRVQTPSKEHILDHFGSQGHSLNGIERAYNLSEGHLGLMQALLSDDSEHPLKNSIEEAKRLASATIFERMAMVDRLSKQKERIPELLYALQRVYRAVLVQASDKGNATQTKRAHAALKRLIEADEMLRHNPNSKLLLTDLFLSL